MSDVLNHPQLKDLNPETEREGLLYSKAYITAIEATLSTVEKFGLEDARKMHEKVMSDLLSRLGDG